MREAARRRWLEPVLARHIHSEDGTPQVTASDGYATGLILHVLQTAGFAANDSTIAKGLGCSGPTRSHWEWRAFSLNKKRDPKSQSPVHGGRRHGLFSARLTIT